MMRWPVAFARFWYDFIVGDSITLALGGVGALAVASVLSRSLDGWMLQLLLPVAIVGTLAASALWHRD